MTADPLELQIQSLATAAVDEGHAFDALAKEAEQLVSALAEQNFDALAYLADLATSNFLACPATDHERRLALLDLCQRLLMAVQSNEPFEFEGLDTCLASMLHSPSVQPAAAGANKSPDDSPGERDTHEEASEPSGSAAEIADASGADHFAPTADSENSKGDTGQSPIGNRSAEAVFEDCQCADADLLDEFLDEADEHLDNAEQLVLLLEQCDDDLEPIHGIFRAVHSLKGSSAILALNPLAELSHVAESMLVRVRDGQLKLDAEVLEVILLSLDYLRRQISSLREGKTSLGATKCLRAPRELLELLEGLIHQGKCDPELLASLRSGSQAAASEAAADATSKQVKNSQESLRVDGRRLEQLIDLIGELVITEGSVAEELKVNETLSSASAASRLKKVVREIQELSLTLKMVPIGTVLSKMNRMVRDISSRLGKPCRLVIQGGETEVDKTLIEGLADPLVHLIRNSLDHGIESNSEERVQAGKAAEATIKISAEHRAGNIAITISDDGRGLNRAKILGRAVEKGLIPAHTQLSETEIDQLIFHPGFSTAEQVSDISGRGVGMDVVRRNVENLRGSILVQSNPGIGTDICIELPLTLSIIDGTVVRVGEREFIIPTLSVIEQIPVSDLEIVERAGQTLARYHDSFVVVDQLSELLDVPRVDQLKHGQVCLVVQACQRKNALLVDHVVGQQAIVIKPLGGVLEAFDYFAGGALLTGGQIGFVLDLNTLFTAKLRAQVAMAGHCATARNLEE